MKKIWIIDTEKKTTVTQAKNCNEKKNMCWKKGTEKSQSPKKDPTQTGRIETKQ